MTKTFKNNRIRALILAGAVSMVASSAAIAKDSSDDVTLDEVTVVANSSSKAFKKGMLKDTILKTEVIEAEDLERSGYSNIVDAVRKSPGISQEVNCSICGARGISLNQLPSQYSTIMVDGIPIYSSVSGVYGLDSIGIEGIQAIEISRGAGTSVIAPEALAGTINVVTKRPEKDEYITNLTYGSYNTKEASFYSSKIVEGGALSLTAFNKSRDHIDEDNNGISEAAQYERENITASFFIDDLYDFKVKGSLNLANEQRAGGAVSSDVGITQASNSGNPFAFANTKNGSNSILDSSNKDDRYNDGLNGISEIIDTRRRQLTTTAEKDTNFGGLRFALGVADHHQDSSYSGEIYVANQDQYYFEAASRFDLGKSELTLGYNYLYQDLDSTGVNADGESVDGIDNYRYVTHGLYTKFYNSAFDDKLETGLSLRADSHSEFDTILTPRANFLLHHNDNLASRVSLGTGYRAPASYFEFEHGLLSVTRINRDIDDVEESQNASYSLNYQGDRLNTTLSYNYTNIENIAVIEIEDGSDDAFFRNSENNVTIQNVDLSLSYLLTPKLTANLGGELNFYKFNTGDLPIARPKQRAFIGAEFEANDNLDLFAQLNWTGKSDTGKFYGRRYNLDGTAKNEESEDFFTLDLRSDIKLSKNIGLALGINNVFDYTQTDDDSQLFLEDPADSGSLDVGNIWGPAIGRYMYATLNVKF